MSFNIDEFLSRISNVGGFIKPSHFTVYIPQPPNVSTSSGDLAFLAESVTTPGASLQTDDILFDGYTLVEKRAQKPSFTELEVGFLVDNNSNALNFFKEWLDNIVDFSDRSKDKFGMMEFPNNYMVDIKIEVYKNNGEKAKEFTLINSFPTVVGGITMAWNSQNDIARFPVTFAYERWRDN